MSTTARQPPPELRESSVDPEDREKENDDMKDTVKWYQGIRVALQDTTKRAAHDTAVRAWDKHVERPGWVNHGLINRRIEEDYLSARAGHDINGHNAKESETVGFIERFFAAMFKENRFVIKSQFGVVPRKGPERQVDNMLGYITIHMREQPTVMMESKRRPPREKMTRGKMTELENQVEDYCRQWLVDNPSIPFIYALTCASTNLRLWVMERKRDMKTTSMKGLWNRNSRTWDDYRDPGLNCDAKIIIDAINAIKDHPNGSDYALTTSSDATSQSDRARSAVPRSTRDRTTESRRTPSRSGDDRPRSRDSRDRSGDQLPMKAESSRRGGRDRSRGERQQPSDAISIPPRSSSKRDPRRTTSSLDHSRDIASSSSPDQLPLRPNRRDRGPDASRRDPSVDGKGKGVGSKRDQDARASFSPLPRSSSDSNPDKNHSSSDNRSPPSKSSKNTAESSADYRRKSRRGGASGGGSIEEY